MAVYWFERGYRLSRGSKQYSNELKLQVVQIYLVEEGSWYDDKNLQCAKSILSKNMDDPI